MEEEDGEVGEGKWVVLHSLSADALNHRVGPPLSLSVSLSLSLSLCLSLSLSGCLAVFLSLSISLVRALSVSLPLSLCRALSLFCSLSLSLSTSRAVRTRLSLDRVLYASPLWATSIKMSIKSPWILGISGLLTFDSRQLSETIT